jgi:membrane protein implicated in regulation of membrane protease activity
MIDFFLLSANTPFVIALALMIAFTVIEIVSASMGMGLSELIDSLLPEFDADIDIDADADIADGGGATGSLAALLAWFRVGEVPVIMLLIVFLTGFGLSGIIVQFMMVSIFGFTVPTLIAVPLALVAAVPTVRFCGGLLGKYMPKDETYAVSEDSFIGMIATLTLGNAEIGKPAEAKVKDKHGQTHYIRVEPDKQAYRFEQGEEGLIVSKDGSIYIIMRIKG